MSCRRRASVRDRSKGIWGVAAENAALSARPWWRLTDSSTDDGPAHGGKFSLNLRRAPTSGERALAWLHAHATAKDE